MSKGPIKVAVEDDPVTEAVMVDSPPEQVVLPRREVLDAGVKKFLEYASLHWPAQRTPEGDFKLAPFDHRNNYHLRVTLGMVFNEMRRVDETSNGVRAVLDVGNSDASAR